MQLKECVAVVTGGASGLGEACVRDLVSFGSKVAILDIKGDQANALADELGDSVIFVHTDVTSEENVKAAISEVRDAFGSVNVAVNCAGIGFAEKVWSKRGSMQLANFNTVVGLNLVGSLNIIIRAVEQMVNNTPNEEGERGVIINTASIAAFDGQVGQAAYSASKAGVVGMTLPIARECAVYGIRVVTIAPGIFETPMMSMLPKEACDKLAESIPFPKRLGRPSEFAMLCRQVLENPMLNGETIRLDGALRMQS